MVLNGLLKTDTDGMRIWKFWKKTEESKKQTHQKSVEKLKKEEFLNWDLLVQEITF